MTVNDGNVQTLSILGNDIIFIGKNITQFIVDKILNSKNSSAYIFISDTNLKDHLANLLAIFNEGIKSRNLKCKVVQYLIPPGEVHKTRKTKEEIEDYLLSQSLTRDSTLIALGGGVIGDLAGFVASTFMRGIPFVQIPTSLLAMVDSGVGGKTGVDTIHGKNLIGSFHQPSFVFIDVAYLRTLNRREFCNGLAEVIKTAAFATREHFVLLENYSERILSLGDHSTTGSSDDDELLIKVIKGSVGVKAHVVSVDEKETGLRGLLNFGHTVGHAIEAIVYPELLHGECVSMGMVVEAEIARHLGHLDNMSVQRLVKCLKAYGLPTSIHDNFVTDKTSKVCELDKMMEIMKVDKKNVGDKKKMVLLKEIGETVEPRASFVEDIVIKRVLASSLEIVPPTKVGSYEVKVPGSKSISNRALLMAALGNGKCRLHGLLYSDDVRYMLESLQKLVGISFDWEGDILTVIGGGGHLKVPRDELYLGNAGTASRFLTSVCTLLKEGEIVLTGNARMKQRPIGPLVEALTSNGCKIEYLESKNCFPLRVSGKGLKGGLIKLSASVSSQYVSSILISAPYAIETVTLDLSGDDVVSKPYIDMTVSMMKSFGIHVQDLGNGKYEIPSGVYQNPSDYYIEADASSATYPLAFAAITGSTVTVTNIGSQSLQGDAEFAVKVLKPMGCTVEQTATTTTVTGLKTLKPLPEIDMESMTDAFLTAAVLAAVATEGGNVTKITGIANQRVKECDRIAAMIEQLEKVGVSASELKTGLEIHAISRPHLKIPANGIKCYDDHRIAMSFSILACAYVTDRGLIINEKKCTEKTWPQWWDTLQNDLKVQLIGSEVTEEKELRNPNRLSNDRVILIGMRGVGKTSIGQMAAKYLDYKFIDMDVYLEEKVGRKIPEFVEKHGWPEFRKLESELLNEVLTQYQTKTIISCGGGVVEAEYNRNLLKTSRSLVVYLKRDLASVTESLAIDTTRPTYQQDFMESFKRREPYYRECSNAEFMILSPSHTKRPMFHYKNVNANFCRFLDFKLGKGFDIPGELSFFVSLTCTRLSSLLPILDSVSVGADAMEVRVDLFESSEIAFVEEQLAILRYYSSLPLVFTVRTVAQGGRFPNEDFDRMLQLLEFAMRSGCEYVDIELTQPFGRFTELLKKRGNSKIIASYHDVAGVGTWGENGSMVQKYLELYPFADIVKLIGKASAFSDNFDLENFKTKVIPSLGLTSKPLITLLMGNDGKLSRIMNTCLTPVTHPELPVSAAPGQVSIKDIFQARSLMGLLPPKRFCLFGSPISHSMSPTIHNTGFMTLGLPHVYGLEETADWRVLKSRMVEYDGASVTIPLKVDIVRNGVVDVIDEAATVIGAVNTLWKDESGRIIGQNTDWIGINRSIEANMFDVSAPYVGIVLGAGGTSRAAIYALKANKRVTEIRVWNRTFERAKDLAEIFNVNAEEDLKSLLKFNGKCNFVIVGTIPAAAQDSIGLHEMFGNMTTPPSGIVVELAYKPRETKLLQLAKAQGPAWHVVEGIQILLEQGYEQFKIWTGRNAPVNIIKETVMKVFQ